MQTDDDASNGAEPATGKGLTHIESEKHIEALINEAVKAPIRGISELRKRGISIEKAGKLDRAEGSKNPIFGFMGKRRVSIDDLAKKMIPCEWGGENFEWIGDSGVVPGLYTWIVPEFGVEGSDAASGDSGPLGNESGVLDVDSGLLVEAE
nr:hypothetical protein Iba_chr10eCG13720 [Ipomoea batatas]